MGETVFHCSIWLRGIPGELLVDLSDDFMLIYNANNAQHSVLIRRALLILAGITISSLHEDLRWAGHKMASDEVHPD